MSGLPALKAIYFDLDDTLCGYWDASSQALAETFDFHRPGNLDQDEMVEHWATAFREFVPEIKSEKWYPEYLASGRESRTEQMRRTLNRIGIVDEKLASDISETYKRLRNERLQLFPDALAVLRKLKPHYPLGLITNGPAEIQRMEIETLGIGSFFSNVFIEGEVGFGKPEQEVFERAAKAVNLGPESLMFVGNSYRHDIRPAVEAGWSSVWIRRPSDVPPSTQGQSARPEFRPEGEPEPTFEIQELSELLTILKI